MVMDPNDRQRHKPSPKHTLEEVRKSLEDMVRNEFDDVAPAAKEQQAEGGESASATDNLAADATGRAHEPLQSLPRRKPVGIDTEQLLRSLKGLISHELAEGEGATGIPESTEAAPAPADAIAVHGNQSEEVTTQEPAAAVPDDGSLENTVEPEEVDNVTLDALSEDSVPEVDLSSEFESEAELLELEAMAEALAEEAERAAPLAINVETSNAEPETAEEPNAEPETAEVAPVATVEQEITPPAQSSPPPSLRIIDLPHTSGPLKAFAVYDPALGGELEIGEAPLPEPRQTDTISEPPVFVSQWLDELSRQPSYSELGLFDQAEKPTSPPRKPTTPDPEDELTIDLSVVTAVPSDVNDDVAKSEAVHTQDRPKAGHERLDESVARTFRWTDMDRLEIPGGEQYVADVGQEPSPTPQPPIDEDGDTSAQLALDIPGEMEESIQSRPPFDEAELARTQSDEIVEADLERIDTAGDNLHADEAERAEEDKTELTLASDHTSPTVEPAAQSHDEQASSMLNLDEQDFVNVPSVDFGGDTAVEAEELLPNKDESPEPTASLGPKPDLASPPATEPRQTSKELSLADGPLLGPSRAQEAADDSATIDLGEPARETGGELPTPVPKESRVSPPDAKEKAPSGSSRVERAPTTGGGIITRRRETPDVASRAAKEKSAPKRDKPPREIKTDKTPSPLKSRPAPLALSDKPTPAPKLGPAVFKLSDEPPPPKEPRVPPAVKEKAPAHSGGAKPSPETRRGLTATAPKSKPAVFKLSDEPAPPPKEPRVPPAVKEKAGDNIIAPSPEKPRATSNAVKEKPAAPRREKPPPEIRVDKTPSAPKPGPTAFTLADEPAAAPKLGPAVFKLSDEPAPPPKEPRVPPAVKEKAPAHSGGAKPSPETERGPTASSASKSGRAVSALADEPIPATKLGPAVFKLSDEPPPPKEPRVPPVVTDKAPMTVGREKKAEGPSTSTHKTTTATAKPRGDTPPVRPRAHASGKGDDIPVLEDAVVSADRLKINPAALSGPKVAPAPPAAERVPAKNTGGARNLAVQVVAKLNTELRKCGERALSPATVDRLQYLLREVLERGSAVVDNSHKKR
jgi:hypothetical protein